MLDRQPDVLPTPGSSIAGPQEPSPMSGDRGGRTLKAGHILAPLATVAAVLGTVAFLSGRFSSSASGAGASAATGLSVERLEDDIAKGQYVDVTPTQYEAVKGPIEIGAMVDAWMYRGKYSNTATADNLNTVIIRQDPSGFVHAGRTYHVAYEAPPRPNTS